MPSNPPPYRDDENRISKLPKIVFSGRKSSKQERIIPIRDLVSDPETVRKAYHVVELTPFLEGVLTDFRERLKHTLSASMQSNPVMDELEQNLYTEALAEYKVKADEINKGKWDFEKDGDTGWKFHLNVTPEHVPAVSTYLKEHGYFHKYLSGGTLDSGKVFTIYIGSYELAKKLGKELSRDLLTFLCKPGVKDEIEFAPGVVGRFNNGGKLSHGSDGGEYSQYGDSGFSILLNDSKFQRSLHMNKQPQEKFLDAANRRAIKDAYAKHGKYFVI